MMVCGHCHGQRVPEPFERIQELLAKGDPFNAGDDLSTFFKPVWRETKIGDYSFENRFWNNGSPRLTAYEYQGILRSKCFTAGEQENKINCLSCHTMHGGDPKGADAQIYILLSNGRPSLDGKYSVFGQVTSGMDVARKIVDGRNGTGQPDVVRRVTVKP